MDLSARSGESWFYAFGQEGESFTAAEYRQKVTEEDLARKIYETLKEMAESDPDTFGAEVEYYYSYLAEHRALRPTSDHAIYVTRAEYTGYTAVLYGRSSLAIHDPEGYEIFHTGSQTKSRYTEDELQEFIRNHLELRESVFQTYFGDGWDNDDSDTIE